MASSGPNNSGSGFSDIGDGDQSWTTGEIWWECNLATIFGHGNGSTTNKIEGDQFGFSIPTGSTINGIVVGITCEDDTDGDYGMSVKAVLLDADGNEVGSTYDADVPNTSGEVTLGAADDTWGTSWTVATINDSSFGFHIWFEWVRISGAYSQANVANNAVEITVYYTAPGYGHKPFSIASASVGKIMGVNSSSVKKFLGV